MFEDRSGRAHILAMVLASLLTGPTGAAAQPRTLREVLAYAREHAPRIQARRAERDRLRAEARTRGFWLPEPPSVSGEWTERRPAGEAEIDDRVLEATLSVEPFGQGVFRARAASAERRLGESEVDARARAWAGEVAWIHHERLRRLWMHERTLRQADVSRRLAEVVQRRLDAGDASGLEFDLARVEAAEGARRVFETERLVHQVGEALAAAIGWPAGTALPEPDSLELVPAFPDTVQLLERALRQRPELLIARAALDLGTAEARLANSRLLPEAEFGVFGGHDDGDEVSGLRLTLSVPFLGPPLMDRGTRAAERRRLEAEVRAASRDGYADVAAAQATAALAFRQVSLFQREILPVIHEARQRYQEAYAIGQVDLTTVLLTEQRYRDAERSFAEGLGAYIDALQDLELATGLPVLSGYELTEEAKP